VEASIDLKGTRSYNSPSIDAEPGSGRKPMRDVYICDAVRTPIGRFGGSLAKVRADDLAATPIKALMAKHPKLDWSALDEVFFGCANQAGEDNRNVARMALLLAGIPDSVPGQTAPRAAPSAPAKSISPLPAAWNR
jgi:3-oxoadipyl-CoA thiolase